MNRKQAGTTVAIVVAIVTAVAVSRHEGGEKAAAANASAASAAAAPITVSLATAATRDVPVAVDSSGSVVPVQTVDVRAQAATTVRTVHIKEGQFVRAGDLLFTLDDRTERANLDKARQQQAHDQAALADARRQLLRSQDLLKQNFIAASAVDTAQAAVDAAQAAVRGDEAAVQAADVALGYDTVHAPLAGRAGAIAVYPGSLVSPTGSVLVTISRIDPVAVSFTVPEGEVAALLKGLGTGSPVRVMPGGDPRTAPGAGASAPAGTGAGAGTSIGASDATPVDGKLVFVDNTIDAATGTIKAKAEFPNASQRLWPGQYVTVHLTLRTLAGAVVIPQAAVIQRGTDHGVYVVGADRTVQWRAIVPRLPFGELVAVDGVRAGERVVTDGKQNLRPGNAVRDAAAANASTEAAR